MNVSGALDERYDSFLLECGVRDSLWQGRQLSFTERNRIFRLAEPLLWRLLAQITVYIFSRFNSINNYQYATILLRSIVTELEMIKRSCESKNLWFFYIDIILNIWKMLQISKYWKENSKRIKAYRNTRIDAEQALRNRNEWAQTEQGLTTSVSDFVARKYPATLVDSVFFWSVNAAVVLSANFPRSTSLVSKISWSVIFASLGHRSLCRMSVFLWVECLLFRTSLLRASWLVRLHRP